MRRLVLTAFVICPLAILAYASLDTVIHRWSWREADLDRNRLNLAYFHGVESGDGLADHIEHGQVLASSGEGLRTRGGDAEVLVRYERHQRDWFGTETPEVDADCYLFTFTDGYHAHFNRVDCPE